MNILPLKQGGSSNSVIINVCFFWKKNQAHKYRRKRKTRVYIYIYIYIATHKKRITPFALTSCRRFPHAIT